MAINFNHFESLTRDTNPCHRELKRLLRTCMISLKQMNQNSKLQHKKGKKCLHVLVLALEH